LSAQQSPRKSIAEVLSRVTPRQTLRKTAKNTVTEALQNRAKDRAWGEAKWDGHVDVDNCELLMDPIHVVHYRRRLF
jgi:hypothetical protein